jgi:hypothetical protein
MAFTSALDEVAIALEASGGDALDQSAKFEMFTESAFKSITSLGDFKKENQGLQAMLADTSNRDALIGVFTGITGSATIAGQMADNFRKKFAAIGRESTPK